jgi:hypothetical protein
MACRGVMRGGRGLRSRFSILNYATMTGHLLYLFGCGWKPRYEILAEIYSVKESFALPAGLGKGIYILVISILDPAGDKPSVRFAIKNYLNGGMHPIGFIGLGVENNAPAYPDFDDMKKDRSLYYDR